MMPTTPIYGWPYPAGTDRVMDGDNAMGALGAAIEATVRAGAQTLGQVVITGGAGTAFNASETKDIVGLTAAVTIAGTANRLIRFTWTMKFNSTGANGRFQSFGNLSPFGGAGNTTIVQNLLPIAGGAGESVIAGMGIISAPAGAYTAKIRATKVDASGGAIYCDPGVMIVEDIGAG